MELTDYVEGSSITWTKNPNYWGFDEKLPENRLPYVDEIVALIMPDSAARLAALRSGQIDMLLQAGDSQLSSIDQVDSLKRTDSDISCGDLSLGPTTHSGSSACAGRRSMTSGYAKPRRWLWIGRRSRTPTSRG